MSNPQITRVGVPDYVPGTPLTAARLQSGTNAIRQLQDVVAPQQSQTQATSAGGSAEGGTAVAIAATGATTSITTDNGDTIDVIDAQTVTLSVPAAAFGGTGGDIQLVLDLTNLRTLLGA